MLLTALALFVQSPEPPQIWEKLIAPGVTYRMEVDPALPLIVNAVRITPKAKGLLMAGELAQGKVYNTDVTTGRETITETAARTSSLVAVNADFFPFTGDPLGAMVRAGELISTPYKNRAAFCWGPGFAQCTSLETTITFRYENKPYVVNGLNQDCPNDAIVLNTPAVGLAYAQRRATHAILSLQEKIAPNGQWKAQVVRMVLDSPTAQVNPGEIALTYRGTLQQQLQFLNVGDEIDLRVTTKGPDWSKVTDVIGGGPRLVRDGKAAVDYAKEGFNADFGAKRHPRTAIGKTKDGDIWIVTVDGRQTVSVGASLDEMAAVMLRFGCTDAVNLDGGGSTTLNIRGLSVNRPSEGSERPVANALLIFTPTAPVPVVGEPTAVIAGAPSIQVGSKTRYRLVDSTGADVDSGEVLWSALGAAWIDQSGNLTATREGMCQIRAGALGWTATLTVEVKRGP